MFKDCHDIAEMHWNNCGASIIELIGYSNRIRREKENLMRPFKNHIEMEVDDCVMIGLEKSDRRAMFSQLTSDFNSPLSKSTLKSKSKDDVHSP